MACSHHLGAQSLVECKQHGLVARSRDRWRDFQLRGVTPSLNDAPGAESQSAHEFSVSTPAPWNGHTGEQDDQGKNI
ncbi:unnamed protein product [Mesocestoides corti]|uniref:Transposase n=1 Tax=Mesocestoides corti TaxID=53468 RepID=A0A0R3U7A6_MESCO|nr:unnamed protein product [Mesocestoides corti]